MLLLPNAGKYKCLLQGKGLQIQINNKTIIYYYTSSDCFPVLRFLNVDART